MYLQVNYCKYPKVTFHLGSFLNIYKHTVHWKKFLNWIIKMSAISSHSALKIEKSRKTQMFLLFTSFFETKSSLRKFVNALFGKIWLITFEEISTTLTKIARFLWNSEHYGQTTTHFFLQTFTLKKCQMMTDFTIYFFFTFQNMC